MTYNYQQASRGLLRYGYEPIPVRDKRPVVSAWQRLEVNMTQVKGWIAEYADFDVGVRSDGALDVDCYHEGVSAGMKKWIKEHIPGNVLIRYGLRPKFLMPCLLDKGVRNKLKSGIFVDDEGRMNCIEVLGEGSQYVCYGIHPDTEAPYEWEDGRGPLDVPAADLPEVGLELLGEMFEEFDRLCIEAGLDQRSKAAPTTIQAPSISGRQLDRNRPGDDYNMSVDLMDVLVEHGFIDMGRTVRKEVRTVGEDGQPISEMQDVRLVLHAGKDPETAKSRSGDIAIIYGVQRVTFFSSSIPNIEEGHAYDAFSFLTYFKYGGDHSECSRALRAAGYGDRRQTAHEEFADLAPVDLIEEFKERFLFIAKDSMVCDLQVPGEEGLMKLKDFKTAYCNIPQTDGRPTTTAWLNDFGRKTARSTVYLPGQDRIVKDVKIDVSYCNTFWMPEWQYTTDESLLDLAIDHLCYILGPKDSVEFWWMVSFVAHMFHDPGVRPTVVPLFISPYQGTGRGWIEALIRACVGAHNCGTTTLSGLAKDDYHGYLHQTLFCSIAEAKEEGKDKYQISNDIREKITAEQLHLNVKYGSQYYAKIFTRIMMSSNHRSCITLPKADRRFFVTTCLHSPRSEEYYNRLYAMLEDPAFLAQFLSWTKRWHEKHNWNPKANPPDNHHKRVLTASGSSPIEDAIQTVIRSDVLPAVGAFPQILAKVMVDLKGYGEFEDDEFGSTMSVRKQLQAVLRDQCASISADSIGAKPMVRSGSGTTCRGKIWILRDEPKWINATLDQVKNEALFWPYSNANEAAKLESLPDSVSKLFEM